MLEVIYLISRARPSGPINQALNILKGLKQKKDVHAVLVTLAPEMKERSWMQRFHDAGIDVVQFNQPLWKTWKCISMLDNYVKEHNIQIIHSAGYRADFVSTMAKCSAKKVSTQRCRPDEIAEKFPKFFHPVIEQAHLKIVKRMDAAVACSYSLQNVFQEEFNLTLEAVQNGVNTEKFQPASQEEKNRLRNKYGVKQDEKAYLIIGSLRERKNVGLIIEAFKKWGNSHVILFVVGTGPDEEKLRYLAKEDKRIVFAGKSTNPLEFYQMADIIVSCSLAEGLPNTILEGMACGLPLILSDIEPHKELLNDNRYGALFRNNDANSLLNALMVSENWNITEMSDYVRKAAVEEHSINRLASDYTEIYKKMLM